MKIKPYIDKLNTSKQFQEFQKKNPEAYFSAGFFVLDFETGKNIHQIDYYLPKKNKVCVFMLDSKEVEFKEGDIANKRTPKPIKKDINLDLDILKGIVEDEMKNHNVTKKLHKIIAVIQNTKGKLVWNLNCITSDMGIMKIHIDDQDHSILKFEDVNLFDAVRGM